MFRRLKKLRSVAIDEPLWLTIIVNITSALVAIIAVILLVVEKRVGII